MVSKPAAAGFNRPVQGDFQDGQTGYERHTSLSLTELDDLSRRLKTHLAADNSGIPAISVRQQIFLLELSLKYYDKGTLEDDRAHFRALLDSIQNRIQEKPELRAEFESHSLCQNFDRYRKAVKNTKKPTTIWVPTSELSDEQKVARRTYNAERQKDYRRRKGNGLKAKI